MTSDDGLGRRVAITVNLFESDARAIEELARERGTNGTEALRGAIATEKFLRHLLSTGVLYFQKDGQSEPQRIVLRDLP